MEAVYQEALAIELGLQDIPFRREVELPIRYRGQLLQASYRADFVCDGDVVVELKALAKLSSIEQAQILDYLKAAGLDTGLLLNFGSPSLQYKRFTRAPY